MTAENFNDATQFLLTRQPFRPFTIVLNEGERLQVDHLAALLMIPERGLAYVAGPGGRLHAFDSHSVSQLVDDIDNAPLDPEQLRAAAG